MKKKKIDKATGIPKQPIGRVFANNLRILGKSLKFAPLYTIITLLCEAVRGLNNAASAYVAYFLLNSVSSPDFSLKKSLILIGAMAAFWAVSLAITNLCEHVICPPLSEKLLLRVHEELFTKAQTLDLACFDDPAFFNDYVWAMNKGGHEVLEVVNNVGRVVRFFISFASMSLLSVLIDPWITVLLLVTAVISVVINALDNRNWFRRETEATPIWREGGYYTRVFSQPEYAKELRMGRIAASFVEASAQNTRDDWKNAHKHNLFSSATWSLFSLIRYAGNALIVVLVLKKLAAGEILLGSFAAATLVVFAFSWQLINLIDRLGKFKQSSRFLEKYFGFLSYVPKIVSGTEEVPPFESLALRDVTFTYDFTDHPRYELHKAGEEKPVAEPYKALSGVNMELRRGEKIAIVGYNGAGKTTLIKLLMRLYDPAEGQVLYNGQDIRSFDLNDYRNRIGVVFQDFALFAASLGENVMNGEYLPERDEETARAALHAAGFDEKLATLEKGLDTPLTREFDETGTNLSGGESQKVAIARVFTKPYDLVIMDEPSAALDPVAEFNLNKAIKEYAADKTVIFISHRLSTTRMADRIYMFAGGELVEVGSHDELMRMKGKYAEMFDLQAENYLKENGEALPAD